MKKLLGIVVALFCGVLQAEDFYWSGNGGDGRWDNVANWATNAALTSPATRCPAAGLKVYFILDKVENHELTVTVPEGAGCSLIYVKDDTAPCTLKLVGEPLPGATRANLNNTSTFSLYGTVGTTKGVTLIVEDIAFAVRPIGSFGSIPDTHVYLKNCSASFLNGTASQDVSMPGGANSSFGCTDCELTDIKSLTRANAGENFEVGITNSTIVCTYQFYVRGPRAKIDVRDTDLTIAATFQLGVSGDSDITGYVSHSTIRNRNASGSGLKFVGDRNEFTFDHVDFSDATKSWTKIEHSGTDQVLHFINSDLNLTATSTLLGTYDLTDSVLAAVGGSYMIGSSSGLRFVLRGARTRLLPGKRFQAGQIHFDFIVPEGGYKQVPIGCDGDQFVSDNNFFNAVSQGTINVLPESPAARVDETAIYPLFYVYESGKNKRLDLSRATPLTLPNGDSQFLVTDDPLLSMAELTDGDWTTPIELGDKAMHAGLAVKIVGHDSRPPTVTSLVYTGLSGDALTFALDLADLGELPAGGLATTVSPTLIYRSAGGDSWTEVAQAAITETGVATLTAPKHGFADGSYEIGVRLVNDIEGRVEYIIPDAVEITFSRATISELGYVGEGVEATITGTVTGTGSADSLPAILEVSESEAFADITATYELGLFTPGAAFEKTVIINPGVMTYYRVTVGEGSGAAQATVSGVSRTVATLGEFTAVNTNGLCRVVVDGTLTARGAGDSTVKLRYSMDGENWKTNVVGTIAADGTAFTGACAFPMDEGTAYYEILVENTSGDHTWVSASGVQSLPVKDTSTYYWRDVEGEWDGNWNNGRHWYKPDLPDDVMLYPRTSRVTASFRDCPTDEGVTVTLPENVTVKEVGSTASSQKLTFSGSSSVTLTASMNFSNVASEYVFDGLAVECPTTDVKVYTTGNSCSYAFTGGAQARFKSFGTNNGSSIQLTIGEDAVLTLSATGGDNGSKSVLVDNGKLVHAGFVGQNYATATVSYRLRGKKARVEFTARATYLNNAWKNVQFIFEIPEGGYDEIPVQLTNGAGSFLYFSNNSGLLASAFCKPGDDNGLIYAIADNSPALLKGQGRTIEQDLFQWNKTGFAFDHDNANEAMRYDLLDYTKLQVPTVNSLGNKVKRLTMTMRGIDDVTYASPAAVKAAGTTAYAVSYRIEKAPGVAIIVR